MDKIKSFIKNKWTKTVFFVSLFVAYAVITTALLGTACMSKLLFGVPCPGCGLTRANLAALRFDFGEAFRMHPIWFVSVIGAGLLIFAVAKPELRKKKWFSGLWIALGAAMCVVFVIRIFTTAPEPPLDTADKSLLMLILDFFKGLFRAG